LTAALLAGASIARFGNGADRGRKEKPRSEVPLFSRISVSNSGVFYGTSASLVRGAVRLVCWASEVTKYRASLNASDG
jgi:hypothetical protein